MTMADTLKIVLADDHVLVRDGIKSLLEEQQDLQVVAEASDGKLALDVLQKTEADLLIVDIRMPEMNGIEVISALKHAGNPIKILVLSMHDSEEYVLKSLKAGADGYLLKGASKKEFIKAIEMVASGQKYFAGDISSIIINNFVDFNNPQAARPQQNQNPEIHLTRREQQILDLILDGLTNKDIASKLKISKRTAEVHRFNLMKKLDVKNQIELSIKAKELALIS